MKYKIEVSYEEKSAEKGKPDFELTVSSTFDDEAAKIVAEMIGNFNEEFAEWRNKRFQSGGKTDEPKS